MSRQLTFDLPPVAAFRSENYFIAGSNVTAHTQIMDAEWPEGRMLLIGPAGAGKSHLAHLWAEMRGARVMDACDPRLDDLPDAPRALVVEEVAAAAGLPQVEVALFHLWNRMAGQGLLLMTERTPPRDWGLGLPDLLSRMQAMPVARLGAPDDALLAAVLVKLFGDRQVYVQPNLIAFLVARIERSVSAARAVVAALDAHALARGRPITRSLAAELLGNDPCAADLLDTLGLSVKD